MAEITETPDTTVTDVSKTPQTAEDSVQRCAIADLNPNTTRTTKPGLKRLILILTVLSSFILGLPFLLKSIEIYRSPLPFHDIDSLADRLGSNPLHFPCRFQAVFLGFDRRKSGDYFDAKKLGFTLLEEMGKLSGNDSKCGGCEKNYTVSVTIESGADCVRNQDSGTECLWRCRETGISELNDDLKDEDEVVDKWLDSVLERNEGCSAHGGEVYSVVVMNSEGETRVVVGKHRHAWIKGRVLEMNAVQMVADIFVKYFMNGRKEDASVQGEFMPVGADGRIILSFSLLNADPQHWIYNWDFRRIEEVILFPVIEGLSAVANISVESQVLYHTPKSSFSYWDEKLSSFIFRTKDLPFFVNSNEWHLDTSIAAGGRSKVLQFVVYILSLILLHFLVSFLIFCSYLLS